MADDKEFIDFHLDAILNASGSSLKNYSMHQTREGMRKALRAALAATPHQPEGQQDKPVYWSVKWNGEHCSNIWRTEKDAKACVDRLNKAHPADKREAVPLYERSAPVH